MARTPRSTGFGKLLTDIESRLGTAANVESAKPAMAHPLILDGVRLSSANGTMSSAYANEEVPASPSPHPGLATSEAISAALGPLNDLDATALGRLRRSFAQNNHPDMFAPEHRDLANARMTLANTAIDRAMSSLKDKSSQKR